MGVKSFLRALVVSCALLPSLVLASWDEAKVVVDKASASMFSILSDSEAATDAEKFETVMTDIDQALSTVVDFDYISKLVMGKYYRQATPQQQAEFAGVFKDTLYRTYAKALVGFEMESYSISPPISESPKPQNQIVTVNVVSKSGNQYSLLYYMVDRGDGFQLVNVVLNGINLRLTFKNQFASIVQRNRGNIAKSIADWREQVGGTGA
ncbi:MAG: MlaC/ttg2D family ABC transporter substrate-binding protein [Pontibacterium sp.]